MTSTGGQSRKPFKVMDRRRVMKKGIMASSMAELVEKGKHKLGYPVDKSLQLVLEEDGTEVEDEDYFSTLPPNTTLMLLFSEDRWSPFAAGDATDSSGGGGGCPRQPLNTLLARLEAEPGSIALLGEQELELLAEMEVASLHTEGFSRFSPSFLQQLQAAADRHLLEKQQIRDTLGLLRVYHNSTSSGEAIDGRGEASVPRARESPRKRFKKDGDVVG